MSVRINQHYDGYVQGPGYSYSQMAVDVIEVENKKWLLDYDRLVAGEKSIGQLLTRFLLGRGLRVQGWTVPAQGQDGVEL
jgi:hypothetical protein